MALETAGLTELGFALDDTEGYTWAILVETADVEILSGFVWDAFEIAWGFRNQCQRDIAELKVLPHVKRPMTSIN